MKDRITHILLILIIFIFIACTKIFGPSKDDFINAYKELMIAKEQFSDSVKLADTYKLIYEKYNYTQKSFNEDMNKYQKNTDEFLSILDSVRARATRDAIDLEQKKHADEE